MFSKVENIKFVNKTKKKSSVKTGCAQSLSLVLHIPKTQSKQPHSEVDQFAHTYMWLVFTPLILPLPASGETTKQQMLPDPCQTEASLQKDCSRFSQKQSPNKTCYANNLQNKEMTLSNTRVNKILQADKSENCIQELELATSSQRGTPSTPLNAKYHLVTLHTCIGKSSLGHILHYKRKLIVWDVL